MFKLIVRDRRFRIISEEYFQRYSELEGRALIAESLGYKVTIEVG